MPLQLEIEKIFNTQYVTHLSENATDGLSDIFANIKNNIITVLGDINIIQQSRINIPLKIGRAHV